MREGYLELADIFKERMIIVDATKPIDKFNQKSKLTY
ncbi:MAG: hypothetical protein Ct9H300mP6_14510 [Gammaproteobacteria bacterium]|nr:MAG: hypothetical protein Ct9H300mP6_14510 [Gammaproteobacteria bacterium]